MAGRNEKASQHDKGNGKVKQNQNTTVKKKNDDEV